MKKANHRLYALRQLRRCGVSEHDRVIAYCSLVRSILEYACVVFAALQQYLSDSLERIQKGALAIIFPGSSYSEALNFAGISTLQDPRSAACRKFIEQLKSDNPVYKLVASRLESTSASAHFSLRSRGCELRKLPQVGLVTLSQTNTLLTWCNVLLVLFVLLLYIIV